MVSQVKKKLDITGGRADIASVDYVRIIALQF